MAEAISEKSRVRTFAEQQMLRHGWQPGKGLGRHEDGMSEPIKVKVKCGKGGVGHNLGEQFTFKWWDHVFNKASSNLSVESGQDGITVKKVNDDEEEKGMISNKRPLKAMLSKDMAYGRFVKSATLLSGEEQPEQRASSSDDSSDSEDDDDDRKLDLSSAAHLTDAELLKVCGGRTAHKGARHGLTMNAKLARLEQQEQEFMAKYGKKATAVAPCTEPPTLPATQSSSNEDGAPKKTKPKKEKKKRSEAEEIQDSVVVLEIPDIPDEGRKQKRKKKKSSAEQTDTDAGEAPLEDQQADDAESKKKKKKKKKRSRNQETEETNGEDFKDDVTIVTAEEPIADQSAATDVDFQKTSKKKRSKKSLSGVANGVASVASGHHTDTIHGCEEDCEVTAEAKEECPVHQQELVDVGPKKTKTKKKKLSSKSKEDIPTLHEEQTQNEEPAEEVPGVTEGEERTAGKSKAKKRKACKENENGLTDGDSTTTKKRKKGKRKDGPTCE
ncbi:G patch domain-containing protein 4 [Clupea harengus]|uniref:G patch domain-containing protein 4 n=1 Tax=Clupea harengus TaxID=7950 RepID=A0A6P3VJ66_CLUHA|nr:G patch domain-containing protein 4 [Clupea harengus]